MKKVLRPLALGTALLLATPTIQVVQAQGIGVLVDGRPVNFGGVPPTNAGGRLLVPLRGVFEALGATVDYNAATSTVLALRGETQLQLTIGSATAYINGQPKQLDVPAKVVLGRTLVPLRFIGEALGAQVNYNGVTQTVSIVSPPTGGNAGGLPVENPYPQPTPPPYTVPGTANAVTGSFVNASNTTITVLVDNAQRVYPLAPNALILRQASIADNATATPFRQPARQIKLGDLMAGDSLKLSVDAAGQVTQITSSVTIILAKVQFAAGNRIVLDDERDTTLSINENLRYINPQNRAVNAASLQAGDTVALFISPTSRTIYQVSSYGPDLNRNATGGTPDPLPGGGLPTGAPQIQLVQHNAATPLKAGATLQVSLRGTPGLRAVFALSPRVQNVALVESPTTPGVYSGTYTIRPGDDILNGRISARLIGDNNLEDFQQSVQQVTIDTVPPRLVGTFPANNSQIASTQPNIAIFADDLGGSGLGTAQVNIVDNPGTVNQRIVPANATVAPPGSINAVPTQPIDGPVQVRAVITDKAGNALPVNFGFTVTTSTVTNPLTQGNAITSLTHNATRALAPGEELTLFMTAQPGGRASFDATSGNGNLDLGTNVQMTEIANQPGRYRGTFRIPVNAPRRIRITGQFVSAGGARSEMEATATVATVDAPVNTKLAIQTPADEDRVTSPITIRGQAAPGAIVDIALRAEGTQFFILEYKEELGTTQVRADDNGNWQTKAIELPARRNVSDLRYIITATQTDAANQQGEPVSVTVRTK